MSWIGEFAGKAETFLNKIDKNAAALVEETHLAGGVGKKGKTGSSIISPANEDHRQKTVLAENYPHVVTKGHNGDRKKGNFQEESCRKAHESSFASTRKKSNSMPFHSEDDLIEFLNEPLSHSKPTIAASSGVQSHVKMKVADKMQTSGTTESSNNSDFEKLQFDEREVVSSCDHQDFSESRHDAVEESSKIESPDEPSESTTKAKEEENGIKDDIIEEHFFGAHHQLEVETEAVDEEVNSEVTASPSRTPVAVTKGDKNEEEENHSAYAAEIRSLTVELSQLSARTATAEKEADRLRGVVTIQGKDLLSKERALLDITKQYEDVRGEADMKKAALENLNKQIIEAKAELKAVTKERSELSQVKRATEADLEKSKQDLAAANSDLDEVCRQLRTNEEASMQTIKGLEDSCGRLRVLNQSVTGQLNERDSRIVALEASVGEVKNSLANAENELKGYKTKAQKILAEKDAMISKLRGGEATNILGGPTALQVEHEQILIERNLLRGDVQKLTSTLENLRDDAKAMEVQLTSQSEAMERMKAEASRALQAEATYRGQLEAQLRSASDEVHNLQVDLTRQKSEFLSRLKESQAEADEKIRIKQVEEQEKEEEEDKREKTTMVQARKDDENPEVSEAAMASLTTALLERQASLEAVLAEKTALALQLERLEKSHASCQRPPFQSNGVRGEDVGGEDLLEGGLRERLGAGGGGFVGDAGVLGDLPSALVVRKAYTSMDKFSVRIGTSLRRNPLARVAILLYMIILHLWVFVVLFSSTPDLHMK